MKKLILLMCFILLNSCKAQKTINTIYDKNLIQNLTNQFSKEINTDPYRSTFAIYFQEKPLVTEVKNNTSNKNKYEGFIVTIYKFQNEYQINEFVKDFNVYKTRSNIFCIFDKNSKTTFLKSIKINKVSKSYSSNSNNYYDPKTWILNFDSNGKLEKCYPYECD
ncbi:MAG: hypothetical protein MUW56_20955 [Chryseobacterium sp.]|uniref:hypothetical protein n=1 Tax=Chryseobacterium sp. TaxID=1871047 RepID=UPI0025BC3F86|nr:hypothetical protein [Chryseobacterium sp.]MCJ7936026.1 hypothetical protein [Chryseobacterium sp.]